MSEFAGFDLDRSTERAWSRFQARLADHLADLAEDDVLVISVESAVDDDADGAAPYVQFVAWGETSIRSEVSSNAYLAAEVRLDGAGQAAVEALGWHAPTVATDDDPDAGSANYYLDTERTSADRLAVMSTRALRDVFGVAHPAFLSASGVDEDVEPELGIPSGTGPAEPDVEVPAVFPEDHEHLRRLVDAALTPFFGSAPLHDEDDDIPVISGSALVFVRVSEQMPAIELFCCVVHGITDLAAAAFEVAVLNRDQRFLKFVLVEDRVMAHLWLPAYPFAPEHLRAMLSVMSETVDVADDDLAARVGGSRTFEEEPFAESDDDQDETLPGPDDDLDGAASDVGTETTAAMHPAMLTLLQLDADAPGTLTPELTASVCAMDRDLILELITWNGEQEVAWRQARDRAVLRDDAEEAQACQHETDHAEATVNLLRRALRLVVERRLGQDIAGLGYATARRHSPRTRRRDRDLTLPGLEATPEDPGLFDQP